MERCIKFFGFLRTAMRRRRRRAQYSGIIPFRPPQRARAPTLTDADWAKIGL